MKKPSVTRALTILALAALVPASGWAIDGAGGKRQGPPPEAQAACEGKEAGDAVQFTNRRGERVDATCREINDRLVAVPAKALRGDRGAGKWGGDGKRGVNRLTKELDLTKEQQEKVTAILDAEREKMAPLMEKKMASRDKVRAAIHSGSGDEAAIRALAAEKAEIEADLLVARAQAWQQINALLTPEQRQLASQLGPPGRGEGKRECRPRF